LESKLRNETVTHFLPALVFVALVTAVEVTAIRALNHKWIGHGGGAICAGWWNLTESSSDQKKGA
jgi:hypothetical protein